MKKFEEAARLLFPLDNDASRNNRTGFELGAWCVLDAMKSNRASTERWAAFGRAVMAQHKDGDCGDVDGGWLQETGVQTGVLQIIEAKEPCSEEGCMCAATCGDWPVDCYRVVAP